MSLSDEIRQLRDRALVDLKSAHDYYTDTTIAWGIVRDVIKSGHTITVRNMTTGTVTTQDDRGDFTSMSISLRQLFSSSFRFLRISSST